MSRIRGPRNWQKIKIERSRLHQEKLATSLNNHNFVSRKNKTVLLEDGKKYIEFISCSYLGLDTDSSVIRSVCQDLDKIGIAFSSARTRLKSIKLDILEKLLNKIFSAHTVLFSSTHLAHLGCIPLLVSGACPGIEIKKNGPVFLIDKHAHASIQILQGIMEQFGKVEKVDCNDLKSLKAKLKEIYSKLQTPFILADSINSMGGFAPIQSLTSLAERYHAYLYLDDAHGMSILGKHGAGYVLEQLQYAFHPRLILTTSLAKAFGTYGGVIALPHQTMQNFIKMYASTYIFSGSPIYPLINASIQSARIHLSPKLDKLQKALFDNIQCFDRCIEKKDRIINLSQRIPIRGIRMGDEFKAIEAGLFLKKRGFLATVATYPVVEKGKSILRLNISAKHSRAAIVKLCSTLNSLI